MTKSHIKKHAGYYIGLFAILATGFFLILGLSNDKKLQMFAVIIVALFYILWGILHHLLNHDITSKIVIEYIFIGTLGISLVLFVMRGI